MAYFAGYNREVSGLKYIFARSDHQSGARNFSYQPIRKLETIPANVRVVFSVSSVYFTRFFGALVFVKKRKMADEQPNSQSPQLDEEDLR